MSTLAVIAWATTLARHHGGRATDRQSPPQSIHLPSPQANQCACSLNRQPPVRQIDQHAQPRQLPLAHLDHRHRTSPRTSRRQLVPVTSLSGTRVTFLSVIYNCEPPLGVMVSRCRGRGGGAAGGARRRAEAGRRGSSAAEPVGSRGLGQSRTVARTTAGGSSVHPRGAG